MRKPLRVFSLLRVRTPLLRAALLSLPLLGGLFTPAVAQTILLVEHNKKPTPVIFAHGSRPYVEENGKPVAADADRYALYKVDDFLPVFVTIRNVKVGTSGLQIDGGSTINNQFEFRGEFSSAYQLDDIFVVLELVFEDGTKSLFLREVGHLDRDHPKKLNLAFATGFPLGRGHYFLHIYAHGMEVLNSEQPFAMREAALDRMIAKRMRDAKDGPPQPFIGPLPEYPEKFLKAKTLGQVKLKLRVRATGAVIDATATEASDPAFGESAIEAMRQWRFLPRVKDGHPVDATVEMPLNFSPPGSPAKS